MHERAPASPRVRAPTHGRVPICPRVRMSARPIKRSCSETARKWPRNRVLARNTRHCAPFARPPPISASIMPGHDKRSRPFRNGPVPELGFVAKIGRQTNMRGDTKKARSLFRDARGRFGGLGADASAVQEQAHAQTRAQVRARAQARTQTRVRTRIQAHPSVNPSSRVLQQRTASGDPSAHPGAHPNGTRAHIRTCAQMRTRASPSANASARPDANPSARPDATERSPEKRTYALLKNAS